MGTSYRTEANRNKETQMMTTSLSEADLTVSPAPSKLGRSTYIIGSVIFMLIGILHTVTHLTELSSPELEERYRAFGDIETSGQTVASWDLWQGTSLLMGFFAIAVGLANLGALRSSGDRRPPVVNCLATMILLGTIGWIGWAYLGPLQLIGAPFGIMLFATALLAGRR